MYHYKNSLPPYSTFHFPRNSITRLTSGLFPHHSLRALLSWPRDLRICFSRFVHLLRYGVVPACSYEAFTYFTDAFRIAFEGLLNNSFSYPFFCPSLENISAVDFYDLTSENWDVAIENGYWYRDSESADEWRKILTRMLVLLDGMDEDNPMYEKWGFREREAAMENAKEEFLRILGRIWWNLWD